MKNKWYNLSITLIALCLNIIIAKAQTVLSQDPIYQLVFADEFDSLGLRDSKWFPSWSYGPNITNSNTVTYKYGNTNVTMDVAFNYFTLNGNPNRGYDTTGSGYHRLISQHENQPVQGFVALYDSTGFIGTQTTPYNFTTAMLLSRNLFKYAYVEMRFKTSNYNASLNNAYAPNLWMFTGDANAAYSEIDISEMNAWDWSTSPCSHYRHLKNIDKYGVPITLAPGYTADDTIFWHGNTFWPDHYSPNLRRHVGPFTPGAWHTIGCEWTPEYIDTYYYSLSADTIQRFPVSNYPVDKLTAMPLIIDNYMPASRDTFYTLYDNAQTRNPFNYDIDYVKVWQVRQNCTSAGFLNIASAGAYSNTLYNDLTIGGSGSTGCYFTSGNSHLAANDFVLLKEGFEISGASTTVLVNTMKCQVGQTMNYNSSTNPGPLPSLQVRRDMKAKQIINKKTND